MPKVCQYGFSCAAMLLQPGLTAEDCPNQQVCGTIIQLTEEERAELYAARMENNRRIVQTVMALSRDTCKIMPHLPLTL